jgi:DNA polymerase III epsilon subunit-like protein
MITTTLVFIDCETTALGPNARPWEVSFIRREPSGGEYRHSLMVGDIDLSDADPKSLEISGFYERHPNYNVNSVALTRPEEAIAQSVEAHTRDAHLVGVNPAFDAGVLDRMLRRHGRIPRWHYHLIDVPAVALGYLAGALDHDGMAPYVIPSIPYRSDDLSRQCGVEPPAPEQRHTADGDAEWAMRWFDEIAGTIGTSR